MTSRPRKCSRAKAYPAMLPRIDVAERHGRRDDPAVEEQPRQRWVELVEHVVVGIERERVRDERQLDRVGQRLERRDDRPDERHEHQQRVADEEDVCQAPGPSTASEWPAGDGHGRPLRRQAGDLDGGRIRAHQDGAEPKIRRWMRVTPKMNTNRIDPDRGRVPEVELRERRVIEVQHDGHQGVVRVAAGTSGDGRLVEQLERADDRDRGHEEVAGSEQWEGDLGERLPGVRAVDGGRLVDLAADRLERRQVEQHERARCGPGVQDDDRVERRVLVTDPVLVRAVAEDRHRAGRTAAPPAGC